MPRMGESRPRGGSLPRCASLQVCQDTKSPAVSGRGLLLPAGAGAEQADGRRRTADLQRLLNQSSHLGQGFTPGTAPSPVTAGGFTSPGTPEWRRHPPALGWPGGTGSTGAQQRCKTGVPGKGQRHRDTHECFPLFCRWLLLPPLPQVSLIRTSAVPTASVLVWAGIQHCLADPKRHLTHS